MQITTKPPGHGLSSDEFAKVTKTSWNVKAEYSWSAGIAISRFLDELRNGKLIGRDCRGCNRTLFPPRMFCEECYRPTDEWRYVEDTGTIETFSISYVDQNANRVAEPTFVGVVSVDGAAKGHGMMHYFGEVAEDEIHIGMAVKAVWKPAAERTGSVRDILYWKPINRPTRKYPKQGIEKVAAKGATAIKGGR